MSTYVVTDSELTSVADAIRAKGGTSSALTFPSGFASAIGDIPSGGGFNLNIEYSDTAPADTSKIWVKATEPSVVRINPPHSIANNSYQDTEKTLNARAMDATCVSIGTDVYIFGGYYNGTYYNSIQKYDTIAKTTTSMSATLPTAAYGCGSVLYNGYVYIFGGSSTSAKLNTVIKYDPTNDTCTTLSATLNTSVSHFAYALVNDDIYIFGGYNSGYRNEIQKFNITSETSSRLNKLLPISMSYSCAASYGNDVYIFGGENNSEQNIILKYDTARNDLTTMSIGFGRAISQMCCARVGTDIYLFGGSLSSGSSTTIYIYNITNASLTSNYYSMSRSLRCASCASVVDTIYIFGGIYDGGNPTDKIFKCYANTVIPNGEGHIEIMSPQSSFRNPPAQRFNIINSPSFTLGANYLHYSIGNESDKGVPQKSYYHNGTSWVSTC